MSGIDILKIKLLIIGCIILIVHPVVYSQSNNIDCPDGQIKKYINNNQLHWKCEDDFTILPITLLSFNASNISQNIIKVSWTISNSVNHSYYIVQWSEDCEEWRDIRTTNTYIYHRTMSINNYYRLVSVDIGSELNYYKIIYCKVEQQPMVIYDIYGSKLNTIEYNKLLIINGRLTIIKQ